MFQSVFALPIILSLTLIASAEQMKFTRTSIHDPAVANIEGATLLIPEGWKLEGGFQWMPTYSMQANLLIRVTDPKTGSAVEMLPSQQFNFPTRDMGTPIQMGSNWLGSVLLPPPNSAEEFVRSVYMPQSLAHLQQAKLQKNEDLPKLAGEVSRSIPANAQITVRANRLRYRYTANGHQWDEDVYCILSIAPNNGWTQMWWCGGWAMRAPAGQLEKMQPVLTVPIQSIRYTLDWSAMLEQVRALFRQGNQQVMADQRRVHEMWRQNQEQMRQQWKQVYEDRQAAQERQNFALREILGGVETYKDPYESRNIELPQGYRNYWVNNHGTYVLSNDVNYDPRQGSTQDWKKMERYSP